MSLPRSGALLSAALAVFACDDAGLDARSQTIATVMARADESIIRGRPLLAQSKYEVMNGSLFDFYRGTFPLYLHDAENGGILAPSAFDEAGLLPLTIGDAHPENFGVMRASDGTFALEPNDFDAADRYPYLWEVRRLAIGMVVAARSSNPSNPEALALVRADERAIAREVAASYADAVRALDAGGALVRITDGGDSPNLLDIFARALAAADTRSELAAKTVLDETGTHRRLLRGGFDPADANKVYAELPKNVRGAVEATVVSYRDTLLAPPPAAYFTILDAAREYGSGVASLAKVRIAVLIDGATTAPDDDVILELKELGESGAHGWGQPSVNADDPGARILKTSRTLWSRPDAEPLWGTSELLGLPVQLKGDFDAYKGVKVKRLEKSRGTPDAIERLAHDLGALLARMHASGARAHPGTLHSIAATIASNPDRFADEQADVAVRYADVVEGDYRRFQKILAVLGPRLGIPVDSADTPSPDVAALFGAPPARSP